MKTTVIFYFLTNDDFIVYSSWVKYLTFGKVIIWYKVESNFTQLSRVKSTRSSESSYIDHERYRKDARK